MYTNPIVFTRLIINNRRLSVLFMMIFSLCTITIILQQSKRVETSVLTQPAENFPFQSSNSLTYNEVKTLLDQLFDVRISLTDIQLIWNKLIQVWRQILIKFVRDACRLCHQNDSYCYESIDVNRYVHYINESFYPINETKSPLGMGIFYYFDLKKLRSVNNSILSTDVSHCDYFHMIQLMINVQIILHQAQIKYFLTKGTLIGVLRHHDVIPWDTDIDLFVPASATQKILKSFRQVQPLPTKSPMKTSLSSLSSSSSSSVTTTSTTTTTTTTKNSVARLAKE